MDPSRIDDAHVWTVWLSFCWAVAWIAVAVGSSSFVSGRFAELVGSLPRLAASVVMGSPSDLELLTVADVMERYRLRDRRAARRVMDAAGAFRIGAGLFVRRADLLALEERQRAARRQGTALPLPAPSRSRRGAHRPLEPGWWRDDGSSAAA